MEAKQFVDSLFQGYEETAALADFKEELLGNLNAKIEDFVKKGMGLEAAFAKASAELGDVSALADELSLKKRKEVFEEVYMDIKAYMTAGRVTAYVVFGILAFFGITVACIAFFATDSLNKHIDLTGFFGTMMPFLTAAVTGFTYLGMTQETASMYPVGKKRGAWYSVAAGLIAFGVFTMPIVYFGGKLAKNIAEDIVVIDGLSGATIQNVERIITIVPVISLIIPFVLPGIGILVYLCLTEKDRLKPWAKDFRDKTAAREMALWNDPVVATRFGMFSGAIWVFAIGLFFLLGFIISFKFSWLVFIFAVAFQLVIQGVMSKGVNPSKNSA
ncbi:MAG: permease prefix domain 1-containing protein [Treponema sp.]|nr:permease prefix domain 1-containing protein [Treponema sp.]